MATLKELQKIENMDAVQHLINRVLYAQEDVFSWEEIHKKVKDEMIRLGAESVTKTFKFLYILNDTLDALVQSGNIIQISYTKYKYNHNKKRTIMYSFI